MEPMAAASNTGASDEADGNSFEEMQANSSKECSRNEKSVDESIGSCSMRGSTENSISSPGRESSNDGDERENFVDLPNSESPSSARIGAVDGCPHGVSEKLLYQDDGTSKLSGRVLNFDSGISSHHPFNVDQSQETYGNFSRAEGQGGMDASNITQSVDSLAIEMGQQVHTEASSAYEQNTDSRHAVSQNVPIHINQSVMDSPLEERCRKSSFDAYGSEITGNIEGDIGGLPRIIHAEINPRLMSSTASTSAASIGVGSGSGHAKTKPSTTLRRGKWTVEEEAYVARVIQDFNSGFLDAPAGTTLRSYLSEKLHCDPMRITKKFTGDACIGKRVFHPAVRCASNAAAIDKAQAELDGLERRWRRRLEMQQRETAKKAAASAAAATVVRIPSAAAPVAASAGPQQIKQSVVARTASWLDRANSILQGTSSEGLTTSASAPELASSDGVPSDDIVTQMKEVQRLIHEGPIIQQTSAGLLGYLDQTLPLISSGGSPHTSEEGEQHVQECKGVEPADKRLRRSSINSSGAEDAEALVGFLRSVRASAASEDFSR